MKYEKVNEELRIFSCSISDLTGEQAAHFLQLWEDGATLGMLSLFYDLEEDALVLNRDNKEYPKYLEMAEFVLSADDKTLESFEKSLPESTRETFYVIDNFKRQRKARQEVRIIEHQQPIYRYSPEGDVLRELCCIRNDWLLLSLVYNYGFIQGKRIERRRKNQKGDEKA